VDNSNLPEELRLGMFSTIKNYNAWVRYSNNDHQPLRKDKGFDLRGVAIKVMGVDGEKVLQAYLLLKYQILSFTLNTNMPSRNNKHLSNITILLGLMLFVLVTILYFTYIFRDSNVDRMRSKYFPLIMALEIHKEKTGSYPLKFSEMKQTVPKFNIDPFLTMDKRSEDCIETNDIYCKRNEGKLWAGHFVIAETFHIDLICEFVLGVSTDFKCSK